MNVAARVAQQSAAARSHTERLRAGFLSLSRPRDPHDLGDAEPLGDRPAVRMAPVMPKKVCNDDSGSDSDSADSREEALQAEIDDIPPAMAKKIAKLTHGDPKVLLAARPAVWGCTSYIYGPATYMAPAKHPPLFALEGLRHKPEDIV